MARASASLVRLLEGDYRHAWDRVVGAIAATPSFELEQQAPAEGQLRVVAKRLLGRVSFTVHLVETETGEVEVRVEAEARGLANAEAAMDEMERALPNR